MHIKVMLLIVIGLSNASLLKGILLGTLLCTISADANCRGDEDGDVPFAETTAVHFRVLYRRF